MLPAQRNKIDISSLSEEEQKMFRLYGKLPNRKDLLNTKLKERKYFDSGDYALSKAGKAPQNAVGTAIPNPQVIPHASTVGSSSPPGSCPGAVTSSAGSPGGVSSPVAVASSTSPLQAHRGSIGIPSAAGAGIGSSATAVSAAAANAMSTSPTTSSSAGATGRPAHSQVSTFPIGSTTSTQSGSGSNFTSGTGSLLNAGVGTAMGGSAAGFAGAPGGHSPAKEGSGLGRNEITADDLMEE
ncbi:Endosulfine-domain-containing protein [Tilletiaria anomala UBC 951]|uniref:mRNA stability protein n=1 Tax=Tilletiaria anomala (strain ATCC 24038 / CBS 436.72 / UBC 951) TaxID=1037660 RepID=A0A066V8H3_TILAU|nr:Endosulfine-domain-containing protein [Tilletiaria anomala UBC 951]KDN36593.1 Endosulfine-domain-containing protein [Tilletiaria anomala UBC 951]